MASQSFLTRLIPIAAAGIALAGVLIIVAAPGDVDDLVSLALAGGAAPPRLTGELDGKDAERQKLPVELELVATGLAQVTDIQPVPGDGHRVVVLQKTGRASVLDVRTGTHTPWFTIEVHTRSEMGLLGLAFAPDFATSGVFYTHHSPPSGDKGVITRWTSDPAMQTPPRRGAAILTVEQPYRNHDGGQIRFGPDGYLYVALGDGGSGFDPEGHGQNGKTLLGSLLRIQPGETGYSIPADNPFVGNEQVHDAIFAYGLRNPWRFAFAPDGRILTGDVGQGEYEEVDVVPRGGNLGWAHLEGNNCLEPPCEGFVPPIWVYGRDDGNSVTGGVVARDSKVAGLDGTYLVGDFGSGRLWALDLPKSDGTPAGEPRALGNFPLQPSTFGEDGRGRVYVGDFTRGAIYRLVSPKEG